MGDVVELSFSCPQGYLDAGFEVRFQGEGKTVVRPAFWDGADVWRVRFSAPVGGEWSWETYGLAEAQSGRLEVSASPTLRLEQGSRNLRDSEGRPRYLVADTAWALPYRATLQEAESFAADRSAKGFNAALLMTIQPDMGAEGPWDRTQIDGFDRGFEDLSEGTLRRLRPEYFQHLDQLLEILRSHGIVPIHSPLFYGFGWNGQRVIGPVCPPEDAARYARYLVARYGAWPCLWLPGADGTGHEPAVEAMGEAIASADAYGQPIGIHYNPWQPGNAHWHAPWCAFHLIQTGHIGDHRPDRIRAHFALSPSRAVANGEPTYEGMGGGVHGLDLWQHDEAWDNLCAGGTFGTFYGAGSLWQWKREGETAWGNWSCGPWDWRHALDLPGSRFPGVVGRALDGLDFAEMSPDDGLARADRCVSVRGKFALIYRPLGGTFLVEPGAFPAGTPWRILDTRTGAELARGDQILVPEGSDAARFESGSDQPACLVIGAPWQPA